MDTQSNAAPAQADKDKEKKVDSILYLGKDERYWNQIIERVIKVGKGKPIQYKMRKMTSFKDIFRNVLRIIYIRPKVIYLDFTVNPAFATLFARVLRQLHFTKTIEVIGLFDQNADVKLAIESASNGVYINHFKGIEMHDIAFDALVMVFKDSIKCDFAKAPSKDEIEVFEPMRITHLTPEYLNVEGNATFGVTETVALDYDLFKKFIPSSLHQVKEKINTAIRYHYNNAFKMNYLYLDPPLAPEAGEDPKAQKMRDKERTARIDEIKERQLDWIERNIGKIKQQTRVLVIDKELKVLEDFDTVKEKDLPFIIQFQMHLENPGEELNRFMPNIIAFTFEKRKRTAEEIKEEQKKEAASAQAQISSEGLNNKNDDIAEAMKMLKANEEGAFTELVNAIKKIQGYTPIILVFSDHLDHNTQMLQKAFSYPRLIHDKDLPNITKLLQINETYLKLAKAEEDKLLKLKLDKLKAADPRKYRTLKLDDLKEKCVFFASDDKNAVVLFKHTVKLTAISESEMYIDAPKPLQLNSVYEIKKPIEVFFTPVTEKQQGKDVYSYRCLFHSYGETEKTKLRQFVNDTFLIGKRKEREQDALQFQQLNEQAKIKKQQDEQAQEKTDDDEITTTGVPPATEKK